MRNKNIEPMKTKRAGAFTLIELLVVIAIIGIIAGLIINLSGKAATSRKIARVKVELAQLETSIDSYKEKKGFYPPGNGNANQAVTNQLFYELIGTVFNPDNKNNEYLPLNGSEPIGLKPIGDLFGAAGFANSAMDRSEVKNFFTGLKAAQYKEITADGAKAKAKLLVVPVEGPNDIIDVDGRKINPWRYDASSTNRHNPDSYDLWAEILVGGRTNIIGNWKE